MEPIKAKIKLPRHLSIDATCLRFSVDACFKYNDSLEEINCLRLLAKHFVEQGSVRAVCGTGHLTNYLFKHAPELKSQISCIIVDGQSVDEVELNGIPIFSIDEFPLEIDAVLLCDSATFRRWAMQKKIDQLQREIQITSPDIIPDLNWKIVPEYAWIDRGYSIYPIDIPEIKFKSNLDVILMDCPSRIFLMFPNGFAYVAKALKKSGVSFQVADLDVIFYHRFHISRLFDASNFLATSPERNLLEDPWDVAHEALWAEPVVVDFFQPWIQETVSALIKANPKVLAFSIHSRSRYMTEAIVQGVKASLPDVVILVGGYDCQAPEIGAKIFPLADYVAVGEVDVTFPSFIRRLIDEKQLKNVPGYISKYDSPDWSFQPGEIPQDLDAVGSPDYVDWDLDLYRNWNNYRITPVYSTRGCCWGRCRFCHEVSKWRSRSVKSFVNELEELYHRGCYLYSFNESDMNGSPQLLLDICDEIIKRGLHIRLTGQLRIDRRNAPEFFKRLKEAGVVALRFGVDGWSDHVLKLQNKGYNTTLVNQNLRDCHQAGIFIEVNIVVGVPGETDQDILDSAELLIKNRPYIDCIASFNPILLGNGSAYWKDPEKYNICFNGEKEELYAQHPFVVPGSLWYSTELYIDQSIRVTRASTLATMLLENGFNISMIAHRRMNEVHRAEVKRKKLQPQEMKRNLIAKFYCWYRKARELKSEFLKISQMFFCSPKPLFYRLRLKLTHVLQDFLQVSVQSRRLKIENTFYKMVSKNRFDFFLSDNFDAEKCQVKLDPSSYAHPVLVKESFYGFNIIETRDGFVAIKQAYPFDFEKVKTKQYPANVVFKEKQMSTLVQVVLQSVKENVSGI
ncbi:MAG: hypothetical protein A3H43_03855 [Gammaproteobacteria bacterium RIFCSPLOWO2_02_FULL_42_9]|nr:MAG: hypothetical protein A3H43_03855 [Gammaproteobacteria bacterium RIFCSPLOWO2_02_FULL_42_9]